jgi:ABC-type protease/lipase transport system fused ATPase/permease subunit
MARLASLLAPPSTGAIRPKHAAVPAGKGELIRLDQVDVRVGPTERHILKNVSVAFRPGEITVIQGPSGSGKTTLLKVLLGIQPIAAGQIQRNSTSATQGDAVGYLPQAIELFDGSVAQNIARFNAPNSGAVIAAAQLTGLHEILQRLEQGYDTPIGPNGHALSGGQRQRIGLARAVYGQPSLVVLDEPNAQLDNTGEVALYQTLLRLRDQGACVVVVSHRPGASTSADQSIHMEHGAITSCTRAIVHQP